MKKVFIYSYNLELGGIERSLIGLLEAFDPNEFDIDLFLAKQEGELLPLIPKYVHLLPVDTHYQAFGIPIAEALKRGYVIEPFLRLLAKVMNKTLQFFKRDKSISAEGFLYHRSIIRMMKKQPKQYDIAISFAVPYFYVLTKVNAKRKIGWIHTDYQHVHIDLPFIRKMFSKIDMIACVSESVRKNFAGSVRGIDIEKTFVFENIISVRSIRESAKEAADGFCADNSIRLLSVGRFCEAKNFDNVPEICSLLVASGLDVKWYLIGFGGYEELIRRKIAEFDMEERVIILGKKENPYPYMAQCDLYVQPSRYEGKAVTVREAQTFGKPVVITDFPTAKSQLRDGIDGIIVPMDNEGCADGIIRLLDNSKLIKRLVKNCNETDYSNRDEIRKII